MPLVEMCAGGRRPSIRAGPSLTSELWKAITDVILVLLSMRTWHLCQVYGFTLTAKEALVCSLGCVLPAAPGTHPTPNLGTFCDWKKGGESAGCCVGLRNQQTLKLISLAHLVQFSHPQLWTLLFILKTVLQKSLQIETSTLSPVLLCCCTGFQP